MHKKFNKSAGIPRAKMPQIKSADVPEFIKWLSTKDVKSTKVNAKVSTLKPTQLDYNADKVEKLTTAPLHVLQKVIIASSDGYILDGHHRYLALLDIDKNATMPIIKVNIKIKELLDLARKFPKSFTKNINEVMTFNEFKATL